MFRTSEYMRCRKIILIVVFIVLSCFLTERIGAAEDEREWKGNISDQKTKYIRAVTDNEEWVQLWKRAFDKEAPEVDFRHYAVACVFLGYEAVWLYHIDFGKPFVRGNSLIVPYGLIEIVLRLSGPFKASGQYHMKVFKKEKGCEMILEEVKY